MSWKYGVLLILCLICSSSASIPNPNSFSEDEPTCGGVLVASENISSIQTRGFPNKYYRYFHCTWFINTAHENHHVQLNVTVTLYNSVLTKCGILTIYDGTLAPRVPVEKFCTRKLFSYTSSGSKIKVVFTPDDSRTWAAIKLVYTETNATGCGGLTKLHSNTTFLTSPGYLLRYDNNLKCLWTVQASNADSVLHMSVVHSMLEQSPDCIYDSVQVYSDDGTNLLNLGKFCGSDHSEYQSTGDIIHIVFTTDQSKTFAGFRIQVTEVNASDCTYVIKPTTTASYLYSPGYPNQYFNNLRCSWIFMPGSGKTLHLTFFEYDMQGQFPTCDHDNVTLTTLPSDGSFLTRNSTYCGPHVPRPVILPSIVFIRFRTDATVTGSGFKIQYFSTTSSVPHETTNCGRILYAKSSLLYLTSPGYPRSYQNNLLCKWVIIATDPRQRIQIDVRNSYLEAQTMCKYDRVTVYDGNSTSANDALGAWCGRRTPHYCSNHNVVTVLFKTDRSKAFTGFKLSYRQTQERCSCENQHLTASYGLKTFSSPKYPLNYSNNKRCSWRISSSPGSYVQIRVRDMQMEKSRECRRDYVSIYNGLSASSSLIGRICGMVVPTVTSMGPNMFIEFHSDQNIVGRGFLIEYKAVSKSFPACTNGQAYLTLTATYVDSYIESPYYPWSYPSGANCQWLISTESSTYVVQLELQVVDLDQSTRCEDDYLEARDGSSPTSKSLGRWCGSTVSSKVYHSSGSSMLVQFHTGSSSSGTRKGFRLKYSKLFKSHYDFFDYESKASNVSIIIGSAAGCIALIVVVFCLITYSRRARLTSRPPAPHARLSNIPRSREGGSSLEIFMLTRSSENLGGRDNVAMFAQPPPYSEVMKNPQWITDASAPPPYEEGNNSSLATGGNSGSSAVMGNNSNYTMEGNASSDAENNSSVTTGNNSNVVRGNNSNYTMEGNGSSDAENNSGVTTGNNSNLVRGSNSGLAMGVNSSAVMGNNSNFTVEGNASSDAENNSNVVRGSNSGLQTGHNLAVGNTSTMAARCNCEDVTRVMNQSLGATQ